MKHLIYALLPLAVSGCAGALSGGLGLANGAVNGALAGIAPTITDDQIVSNHAETHNLKVRLETIDATTGLVYVQTGPGSIVVTGTPVTPPPVVVPPPTPPPIVTPGGPVVTPNAHRYRRSVRDIENMGELVAE
jgi:hypothetical protein